jgi:hypothetical protein
MFFPGKDSLTAHLRPVKRSGDEWTAGWVFKSDVWCREVVVRMRDPSGLEAGLANAAVPPLILAGMLGPFREVRVRGGVVCPQLYRNAHQAMALMADRFEEAHPVKFKARLGGRTVSKPDISDCVVCFTGGVDSLFSAWTLREKCRGLLYVRGFDIPQENEELFQKVRQRLEILASDLGLPLYTLSTDLRLATDCHGAWGKRAFGPALASMAHLLPNPPGGLVIPASYDLSIFSVGGSMHDLDPLWSSAGTRVIHHGVETSRLDKIRELARWPLALEHLRVCWKNPKNAYNCGRCEKCLRTLILLEIAGLAGQPLPFDAGLDFKTVADVEMASSIVLKQWEQIQQMLREYDPQGALRRAVGTMLERNRKRLGLQSENSD